MSDTFAGFTNFCITATFRAWFVNRCIAVVVAVMTAQALSGLFCFLAAVAVVVHSLVMETAVVAAFYV